MNSLGYKPYNMVPDYGSYCIFIHVLWISNDFSTEIKHFQLESFKVHAELKNTAYKL